MVSLPCPPQGVPDAPQAIADVSPGRPPRTNVQLSLGISHPPGHTPPRPVQGEGACSSAGVRSGVSPSATDPMVLPREGDHHPGVAVHVSRVSPLETADGVMDRTWGRGRGCRTLPGCQGPDGTGAAAQALVGEEGGLCVGHIWLEVSLGHSSQRQIWRFRGEAGVRGVFGAFWEDCN